MRACSGNFAQLFVISRQTLSDRLFFCRDGEWRTDVQQAIAYGTKQRAESAAYVIRHKHPEFWTLRVRTLDAAKEASCSL